MQLNFNYLDDQGSETDECTPFKQSDVSPFQESHNEPETSPFSHFGSPFRQSSQAASPFRAFAENAFCADLSPYVGTPQRAEQSPFANTPLRAESCQFIPSSDVFSSAKITAVDFESSEQDILKNLESYCFDQAGCRMI